MSKTTKDLSEWEPGESILAIFKGDPGTRKTTAACSFPEPYVFDIDKKLVNVHKIFPGKKIAYSNPTSIDEIVEILEDMKNGCRYQTLIMDSLTSIALMTFNDANKFRGQGRDEDKVTRLMKGKIEMSQIEDFNYETRAIFQIMDKLTSIHLRDKVNIILIAHVVKTLEKDIKSKKTTETRTLLTGGKKVAGMLSTQFQEGYHFGLDNSLIGQTGFGVSTASNEEDWAMTALNLPPYFTWTNENFYDKWKALLIEGNEKLKNGELVS